MLDLKLLQNFNKKKDKIKKDSYKKVLKNCHKKIMLASKSGINSCWYTVPELTFGIPLYDVEECANYIFKKIKKDGLQVEYYSPNLLFISWKNIK